MKKCGILLVVLFVAVFGLSGCSVFHDQQTAELPESEPLVTTIMVQLNDGVTWDAALFQSLPNQIKQHNATLPDDAPRITDAKFLVDTASDAGQDYLYTLELTLHNVPSQVVTITVQPFKKVRTQTVFNPLSLMPESPAFTYYLSFVSQRRHSGVTTNLVQRQSDGSYAYFWQDGREIVFTDRYPNPPLYYILALVATVVCGVIIYFVARYFYCKNQPKKL